MKKVWTGHKIYPITDYVNFLALSVTLTLEVGKQVLHMKYHLIIVTIYAKCIQNPLIYEEVIYWTQNILYNSICLPLTSKCDLNLGGRVDGVVFDISSYYCDNLCQVISQPAEVLDWTQSIPSNRL
jgi:hypothetical protein